MNSYLVSPIDSNVTRETSEANSTSDQPVTSNISQGNGESMEPGIVSVQ